MKNISQRNPTVLARIGLFISHAAAEKGVFAQELLKATGFESTVYTDPDARIALALETQLWNTAAELSNDADFGLHAAEMVRPGAFDVFDYVVRTAPDLGSALGRMVRYNKLVHDLAVFNVVERHDTICIEHHFSFADMRPSRHASEFTLASLLIIGGQMTGQLLKPLAVTFPHSKPDRITDHLQIFGVAPVFGAELSSLTLPRSVLECPIADADAGLSRIVMAHAEQLLVNAARAMPNITTTVRNYLAENMAQGPKTLSQLAEQMRMSERSLQRRLESEGTRFAKLADEVRKELALRYIADRRLALGEVAYLLGFAEPSPFHRAFKRWTGMTPAVARQASK
jgi:AraC-like DNA-binding protein